ncbi:MAG: CrcB family protein [Planctomycetaceae bacterium]|nr:CrcB family protein [Planctomycetaceae bacterium]
MNPVMTAAAIGTGGFAGALMRYYFAAWFRSFAPQSMAFVGTIGVNLLGCLLIGILTVLEERRFGLSPFAWRCIIIGVLGSLTTFSTFAIETLGLLQNRQLLTAAANVVMNLGPGLLLVWLGMSLTRLALPG